MIDYDKEGNPQCGPVDKSLWKKPGPVDRSHWSRIHIPYGTVDRDGIMLAEGCLGE